jgi:uncharacterized protein (DUF58 family)
VQASSGSSVAVTLLIIRTDIALSYFRTFELGYWLTYPAVFLFLVSSALGLVSVKGAEVNLLSTQQIEDLDAS